MCLSNREVNNRIVNGWWLVLASELGPEIWHKEIFSGLSWCRVCICGYLLYIIFIKLSTYLYYCSVSQSVVPNVFRNIGGNVMVGQSNLSLACEYEKALLTIPALSLCFCILSENSMQTSVWESMLYFSLTYVVDKQM